METIRMRSKIGNDGHVRVDIPTELPVGEVDILMTLSPIEEHQKRKKYDFSDLAGQLKWAGDPVAEQRVLRDEW